MTNIIEVNYHQTGESKKTNSFGMRDMQAKAYEKINQLFVVEGNKRTEGRLSPSIQ